MGYFQNRILAVFFARKKRVCCHANGVEDASPRQRPGIVPRTVARPESGESPALFQGAPQSMNSETQGVALGKHPPALSAPKDMPLVELWKSQAVATLFLLCPGNCEMAVSTRNAAARLCAGAAGSRWPSCESWPGPGVYRRRKASCCIF